MMWPCVQCTHKTPQITRSSEFDCLTIEEHCRVKGDPKHSCLKKSNARLTMYNNTVMYPIGKCNLTCKKGDVSPNVQFQAVNKELRPLLGAEICQKLKFIKVFLNDTVNALLDDKTTKPFLTKEVIRKEYKDVFEGFGFLGGSLWP